MEFSVPVWAHYQLLEFLLRSGVGSGLTIESGMTVMTLMTDLSRCT